MFMKKRGRTDDVMKTPFLEDVRLSQLCNPPVSFETHFLDGNAVARHCMKKTLGFSQ